MAKKSSIEKNNRRRKLSKRHSGRRTRLKAIARDKSKPMGVATYQFSRGPLPAELRAELPSIERIEAGLAEAELKRFRLGPLYTPPSLKGTIQRPSQNGAANWGGAAASKPPRHERFLSPRHRIDMKAGP